MPTRPRRTGRKGAPAPRSARDRLFRPATIPPGTVRAGRPGRRRYREGGQRQGGASGLTSRRKDITRAGREKRDRVDRKEKGRRDFPPGGRSVGYLSDDERPVKP